MKNIFCALILLFLLAGCTLTQPTVSPIPTSPLAPPLPTETVAPDPTLLPIFLPIDPALYQDWWTYTHPIYHFSIMLPQDWIVDEQTTNDRLLDGHLLNLHPANNSGAENIRLTFRQKGEDIRLWPTGVGQGEFIPQGTIEITGQPAQRILLVCPTGEVTSIWYHQIEDQPNVSRGDLEFGLIFSAGAHCESGHSLDGKVQLLGEMIISSLKVP